jgi:GAF domain-containing protein
MIQRSLRGICAYLAGFIAPTPTPYESQEGRAARLQTLTRLNRLISASLDMDHVLREITQAAAELMEVPCVRIWIADQARQTLECHTYSDDRIGADYPQSRVHFGQGGAGWVAVHRQPLYLPDVFAQEQIQMLAPQWFEMHNLRSLHAVPIIHQNALLGVLSLYSRQPFPLAPV